MEILIDRPNTKLSALREVSLAQEIREAGALEMSSLYMGQSVFIRSSLHMSIDFDTVTRILYLYVSENAI